MTHSRELEELLSQLPHKPLTPPPYLFVERKKQVQMKDPAHFRSPSGLSKYMSCP